MLKVFQRSPCPLSVTLLPVRVQGDQAGGEIAAAIAAANELAPRFGWDVLIVGRGGGSIEDLWPFNEEIVARAMAASSIPTISAVGHEIDFTIADLVSDLRAPTPTAAAEWIVSQLESLERSLSSAQDRLIQAVGKKIDNYGQKLHFLERRLVDPRRRLEDLRLLVDDRLDRLQLAFMRRVEKLRTVCTHLTEKLLFVHPVKDIYRYRSYLDQQYRELILHQHKILDSHRFELQTYASRLETLSPLAVLGRGYSITYRLPDNQVVRKSTEVQPGQIVKVQLQLVAWNVPSRRRRDSGQSYTLRMCCGQKEKRTVRRSAEETSNDRREIGAGRPASRRSHGIFYRGCPPRPVLPSETGGSGEKSSDALER